MAAVAPPCVETKATAPGGAELEDMFELCVCTMAGNMRTLSAPTSCSIEDLQAAVERLLGVPSDAQRWLRGDEELALLGKATLADTPLQSGDTVTVLHTSFVPLARLPDVFELNITSVRHGRLRTGVSSAFTLFYLMRGNMQNLTLEVQPWRKNDHDRFLADGKARMLKVMTSHWMSGESESTTPLGPLGACCPLTEFVKAWNPCAATLVMDDSQKFWRHSADLIRRDAEEQEDGQSRSLRRGGREDQTSPNYDAVQGWFLLPSDECAELAVDIEIPSCNRGKAKKIIRLLIDQEGTPLRAAIKGCTVGSCHQDIEEYDVTLPSPR